MGKSPAFQFYPDAWLSSLDVTLMSPAEEGAYIRLLCHAWLSPDCSLPTDPNALRTLSRLGPAWGKSEERILSKFREEDGRLYNDRLLVERRKQDEWRRKSSEGGRKSVASKSQPKGNGGSRVVEECLEPNANSLSLVSVSLKTPPVVPQGGDADLLADMGWTGVRTTSDDVCDKIVALPIATFLESPSLKSPFMIYCRLCWFDDFFTMYWRKDDKRKARVKYFEKVTSEEIRQQVEDAVINQTPEMMAREKQHRKLAATWLHGECWHNEPTLLDGDE